MTHFAVHFASLRRGRISQASATQASYSATTITPKPRVKS
jgi:hypothetical protein